MLLQSREQAQRLQAVNAELLEEVVVGREALARHLELRGGKVEDFVGRLLLGSHGLYYGKYGCASVLSTNFFSPRSVAGSANNSQKISISRRNSSYGIGLMNFLAAAAVRRSNLVICDAVPLATRRA